MRGRLRHDKLAVVQLTFFSAASLLIACSGAGSGDVTNVRDSGLPDVRIDEDAAIEEDTAPIDTGLIDTAPKNCELRPKCDSAPPAPGPKKGFRHGSTGFGGGANHRGRDLFLKAGQKQWALAKFAYGAPTPDNDAQDEDVEVYLLRDCGSEWKKVGTYRTTNDGAHSTEEGVVDNGGRIYVDLSAVEPIPLAVGRHRVHYVMTGDNSQTDQYIEVLPDDAKVVVTDIDGTMTSSEKASWSEAFGGTPPEANNGGAAVLNAFARRGYYVFYLSARPDFFVQKTRTWLEDKGFPRGIIHVSASSIGETGTAAIDFKSSELANLKTKTGITPSYGFGNTDVDVAAYDNVNIAPAANRYFYKYNTDLKGGTTHDDYSKLVSGFEALPAVCK